MNYTEILSIIMNFCLASGLLYYRQRRRKESAEAGSAELGVIQGFAKEWRDIADRREEQLNIQSTKLNDKIERLYADITVWRNRCGDLEQELNQEKMERQKAEFKACSKRGCVEREPQTGF